MEDASQKPHHDENTTKSDEQENKEREINKGGETNTLRRYHLKRYSPSLHFSRGTLNREDKEYLIKTISKHRLFTGRELIKLYFNRVFSLILANKLILALYTILAIFLLNFILTLVIIKQDIRVDTPGNDLTLEVFITPEDGRGLSKDIKSLSVTSTRLVDPFDYVSFVVKNWKYRKDVDLFDIDYITPSILKDMEESKVLEDTAKMRLGSDILDMQSSVFINMMRYQGVNVPYRQKIKITTVDYPKDYEGLWNIYPDDNILSINGQLIQDPLDVEIARVMYKGNEVSIELEREGAILTVVTELPEMSVGRVITFTDADYYTPFNRFANLYTKNIEGRSAGVSTALSYYDTYIEDVSKGRKIALSGILNPDGTVSPIAGVNLKTIQAIEEEIDILFFANDVSYSMGTQGSIDFNNYTEAKNTLKRYNSDITVVGVDTFNDIIEYLKTTQN